MKTLFLVIFFSTLVFNTYSQDNEHLNCEDLKIILNNEEFRNHFHLKKAKVNLFFIDTFKIFNCDHLTINEKEIIFSNKYSNEISKGDNNCRQLIEDYVVLQSIKKRHNNYYFTFWQPKDNAVIDLKLIKNKKPKVKVISIGVY
jgi:hypothetical protein